MKRFSLEPFHHVDNIMGCYIRGEQDFDFSFWYKSDEDFDVLVMIDDSAFLFSLRGTDDEWGHFSDTIKVSVSNESRSEFKLFLQKDSKYTICRMNLFWTPKNFNG